MHDVAAFTALGVAALKGVAAGFGGWGWWIVSPSRTFWALVRTGQAAAVVLAAVAGVAAASGFDPSDGLFWLYALLPVVVGFVAEQFRATSAQTVLDRRGLEDARAVGRLGEAGQTAGGR